MDHFFASSASPVNSSFQASFQFEPSEVRNFASFSVSGVSAARRADVKTNSRIASVCSIRFILVTTARRNRRGGRNVQPPLRRVLNPVAVASERLRRYCCLMFQMYLTFLPYFVLSPAHSSVVCGRTERSDVSAWPSIISRFVWPLVK